jgi:hypothetical protein
MEEEITAKQLHEKQERGLQAHKSETNPTADLARGFLKMYRANEYATPIDNARTTRAYSVSFPV